MGIFEGVLLVSDFDDTLVNRSKQVPERTGKALELFVKEGGSFTLASGRGLESVRLQAPGLPIGAPVIVANGTQIYDLSTEKLMFEAAFPATAKADFAAVLDAFPTSAVEIFWGRTALCGSAQWGDEDPFGDHRTACEDGRAGRNSDTMGLCQV